MKFLTKFKKIHISYVVLSLLAVSACGEAEPPATVSDAPATVSDAPATVSDEATLAERTAPVGRVYVADEPYMLLLEENKGLKDKLSEAQMQVEDIQGQMADLKSQIAMKDDEITSLKQKATAAAAPAPAAAAAPAGGDAKPAAAGDCQERTIMATATTFEPKVLFINPCDTVHFVNMSTHDAQAFPEMIPEGAEAFHVPININGKVTLDVEGIYVYKCNPHYPLGMAGAIIVGKASNFDQVQANATGRAKGVVIKVKRALAAKG